MEKTHSIRYRFVFSSYPRKKKVNLLKIKTVSVLRKYQERGLRLNEDCEDSSETVRFTGWLDACYWRNNVPESLCDGSVWWIWMPEWKICICENDRKNPRQKTVGLPPEMNELRIIINGYGINEKLPDLSGKPFWCMVWFWRYTDKRSDKKIPD